MSSLDSSSSGVSLRSGEGPPLQWAASRSVSRWSWRSALRIGARGGFASALDAMSGAASLEIVGPAGGIDEQRLAQLDWLSEFGAVSPVIEEGDVVARADQGRRVAARARGRYSPRPGVPQGPAIEFGGGRASAEAPALPGSWSTPDAHLLAGPFRADTTFALAIGSSSTSAIDAARS